MKKILLSILLVIITGCTSNPNCQTIYVTDSIEVYTEADHASNRVALLEPGDVLYICGE